MAPLRKPLTTYSRRSRARAASKADDQASSPLQPLPTEMEDMTITEMTRRMQKRSRQSSSSIAEGGEQIGEGAQKAKKPRNDTVAISEAGQSIPPPYWISSTLSERMTSQLPIQPSQMLETSFRTPCPSFCSEKAMVPSSIAQPVCPEQGDFSPLPAARHMLSRTSSRHLKENRLRALGSPFDSRPPSRVASPSTAQTKGKGRAQRPPRYAKSRTFSVPADPMTMDYGNQGLLVHGGRKTENEYASAIQVGQPRTSLNSHHRTGSIPTVSSTQIAHDWLVHPTALSKTSGLDSSPTHSSFFLDAPNEASTPPRKRHATTGGMYIETQDYDITLSDMSVGSSTSSGAYIQAASHQSPLESDHVPRRPPLRMRRRTITDPSGGSLFSSVLDFSGSAAEEQRASVALDVHGVDSHRRTTADRSHREDHASLTTAFSTLNVGLASAFTPTVDTVQTALGHVLHRSASLPAFHASPVSAQPGTAPGMMCRYSPGDLGGLDSSDSQLRELFTTLRLSDIGDEGPAGVSKLPHLETPEFGSDMLHAPLLSPAPEPDPRRQQIHRRQRADTIRASDFVLPSENPSGGFSGHTPFQESASQCGSVVTDSASLTRRTRSGTVTLASVAASKIAARRAPARTDDGPSQEIQVASPLRGHKRSKSRLPTIQMRTNDEPLKLAPGDDEDDELLLKRGSIID